MAINMMCSNSECKYYYEDSCIRNLNEERIEIDAYGQCKTFEKGTSDWYKTSEEYTKESQNEINELLKSCDPDKRKAIINYGIELALEEEFKRRLYTGNLF